MSATLQTKICYAYHCFFCVFKCTYMSMSSIFLMWPVHHLKNLQTQHPKSFFKVFRKVKKPKSQKFVLGFTKSQIRKLHILPTGLVLVLEHYYWNGTQTTVPPNVSWLLAPHFEDNRLNNDSRIVILQYIKHSNETNVSILDKQYGYLYGLNLCMLIMWILIGFYVFNQCINIVSICFCSFNKCINIVLIFICFHRFNQCINSVSNFYMFL